MFQPFLKNPFFSKNLARADFRDLMAGSLTRMAAQLQKAYEADRETQGESKGAVQGDGKQEKKLRTAAARQLKLNLLEQVKLHIDEPDTVKGLYDPTIFTPTKKADSTPIA